jgi:hypothetical protein
MGVKALNPRNALPPLKKGARGDLERAAEHAAVSAAANLFRTRPPTPDAYFLCPSCFCR